MLFLKNKMLTEQIQYAILNPRNRDNIGTTNTHIHDSSLSLLGIGTSKKGAGFYGPKASLVYECYMHMLYSRRQCTRHLNTGYLCSHM
jgi:hypothetical protein